MGRVGLNLEIKKIITQLYSFGYSEFHVMIVFTREVGLSFKKTKILYLSIYLSIYLYITTELLEDLRGFSMSLRIVLVSKASVTLKSSEEGGTACFCFFCTCMKLYIYIYIYIYIYMCVCVCVCVCIRLPKCSCSFYVLYQVHKSETLWVAKLRKRFQQH